MSTKDISTLETIDEWEAAITKAFQHATREAVLENARLGLSPVKPAVDLLGSSLRETDDVYRAAVPKVADDKPTTNKAG
jgi:hypothetical protein